MNCVLLLFQPFPLVECGALPYSRGTTRIAYELADPPEKRTRGYFGTNNEVTKRSGTEIHGYAHILYIYSQACTS